MSLEEGTSFWSSSLMWKVFFCAAIAFPTYNAGKNVLFTNNTSEFSCTIQIYYVPHNKKFNILILFYRSIRICSQQKYLLFWEV